MIIFKNDVSKKVVINYDDKKLYRVNGEFVDLNTNNVYKLPKHMETVDFNDVMEDAKFKSVWVLHNGVFETNELAFEILHEKIYNPQNLEIIQELFSTYENFYAFSKEQIKETISALSENAEIQTIPFAYISIFNPSCFLSFFGNLFDIFEVREKFCNLSEFVVYDDKPVTKEESCKKLVGISNAQDKEIFKVGDKVYCPYLGTKVFTLESALEFDLSIGNAYFTYDGNAYNKKETRMLFHATPENKIALETLYGTNFADHEFKIVEEIQLPCLCLLADNLETLYDIEKLVDVQNSVAVLDICTVKTVDGFVGLNNVCYFEYAIRAELTSDGKIEILE